MTEILFAAVVAVAILLIVLNNKINTLTMENRVLKNRLDELWYYLGQRTTGKPGVSQAPPHSPHTQAPPPTYYNQPPPPSPYGQVSPTYSQTPPPRTQAPPIPHYNGIPQAAPKPPMPVYTQDLGAAPSYTSPNRGAVVGSPVRISQQAQPRPTAVSSAMRTKSESPGHMESWLGRNVLGVAASVLFFIGLIVFAVWIYNDIPDTVKIILMYVISGSITAVGIFLTLRHRNNFTLILAGCGCGLLFISLLLSQAYFNIFNDIFAYCLLLVWLFAVLLLAKKLSSVLISIIAHLGMGFSLCFGYAVGLSDERLLVLLIYQAVSIAVIVLGNILCCKRTYRLGLFLSVIMSLVAESFMASRFIGFSSFSADVFPFTNLPDTAVALSFFAQFLCISFLSYLLAVSSSKLKNAELRSLIHIANKLLWVIALCSNVLPVVFRMAYAYSGIVSFHPALSIMTSVGLIILISHGVISLFMGRKSEFNKVQETISVLICAGISAALLFLFFASGLINGSSPVLPLFILPALLLLLVGLRGKNRIYCLGANILLGAEWVLMSVYSFHDLTRLGTVALPLLYMAFYAALIWLQLLLKPESERARSSLGYRTFIYFFLQLTALIILAGSGYRYWYITLILSLIIFNLLLILLKFDRDHRPALTRCMRATEGVILAAGAIVVALVPHSGAAETALYVVLTAFLAVYAFYRVPLTLGKGRAESDLFTASKFTLLTLAVIRGFTPWMNYMYAFTLTVLTCGLLCLAVGYALKSRGLTRYGLIVSIPCVVKLYCFDVLFTNGFSQLAVLLTGSLMFLLVYLLHRRITDKSASIPSIFTEITRYLILVVSAAVIAFFPYGGAAETTLIILLTVLTFIWAFMFTPKRLHQLNSHEAVIEGIKFTVLILSAVQGYTDWFASAYVFSLVCMLTSLICVIAGFIWRWGSLRLYGLILTLVCVLKLVTWDVAGLDTLLRILSLIGGGVICFTISAIYSYSVKRLPGSNQKFR